MTKFIPFSLESDCVGRNPVAVVVMHDGRCLPYFRRDLARRIAQANRLPGFWRVKR